MELQVLFNDKTLKPKEKTELVSQWLLREELEADALICFAKTAKDPVKASCIEAIEFLTASHPERGTSDCFDFALECLEEKAPRIKWESAKVIGNSPNVSRKRAKKRLNHFLKMPVMKERSSAGVQPSH